MKTFVVGGLKRRKNNGRFVKKTSEITKRRRIDVHGDDDGCSDKTKNSVQSSNKSSWQEGRRIVELGWISEQLRKGCSECEEPLCLWDTKTETRQGLGSILYIECRSCGQLCSIKTGKTHRDPGKKKVGRAIWDVNTKAAAASVNTGLGATGLNVLLTSLNIPWLDKNTYKKREIEAGKGIITVSKRSCEAALRKEVEAEMKSSTDEYSDSDGVNEAKINASFDAAWQKRGSGRSYNSLSGHSTMVGSKTGKILDYTVRCKHCRVCEYAKRSNTQAKEHECLVNWDGSAKAMEPSMGVELSQKLSGEVELPHETAEETNKIKYSIGNVIMDGDTTTISHIRKEVDGNIGIWSDVGHAKKALYNHLMTIGSNHKSLTRNVSEYLTTCFGYVLSQNKGNPKGIQSGCKVIPKHAFGDHASCGDWCEYLKDPSTYRHKRLAHGKDLEGEDLKAELVQVFDLFSGYAKKLAPLGSTQKNEAINNSITVHAPKRIHFSGSGSLQRRVGMAVAKNNDGHTSICEVNRAVNLSPGSFTMKFNLRRDEEYRKRKSRESTRKFKRKRVNRKKIRSKRTEITEVLEGTTYESGVQFTESAENPIPIPSPQPKPVCSPVIRSAVKNSVYIVYDIETSNIGLDAAEICQLSAVALSDDNESMSFDQYILPKHGISQRASQANKLTVVAGKLLYNCRAVDSVTLHECLMRFLRFLKQHQRKVILVAHNNKVFDARILTKAYQSMNLYGELQSHVVGFVDTLPLFRSLLPGRKSYKQESLVHDCMGLSYDAHNGLADVKALKGLLLHLDPGDDAFEQHSFSLGYISECLDYHLRITQNLPSLRPLITNLVVSKAMCQKIAGVGLSLQHLKLIHTRGGSKGIKNVLSAKDDMKKPCVTASKKILARVTKYLDKIK